MSGELNPPEKAESLTEALLIDPLRPLTVLNRLPALFADGWHSHELEVASESPDGG